MKPRHFIDTNVLIYSYDRAQPRKRECSLAVLADVIASRTGVISTQVMQEFVSVATRKLSMSPLTAKAAIEAWVGFETVLITPAMITSAAETMDRHRLSFWDSLILTAASSAHCTELLSEDMSDGATIGGVRVRNPFRTGST